MKPKTLILMVVAVVCGLGASYMTSRLLAEREDRQPVVQPKEPEKVKLLVAKKELNMHTFIKNPQEYFVEKELVKENLPKEVVNDLSLLKGKTLRRTLHKDEPVIPEDLNDGSPVLEVPPGHQAMGLSVNVHTSAGGFASLPGSRVDIVWTRKGNNDQKSFSKTLLQNVLVLAADANKNRTDDGAPIAASVVTLALTPDDVRRVANAAESGTMRLVLRIPGDNSIVKNDTTTLEQTSRGGSDKGEIRETEEIKPPSTEETPPQGQPEPKYKTHVVWFRQGDKQWKEVFKLDLHGNVITEDDEARAEAPPAPPAPVVQPAPPQQPAIVAPRALPKDR